MIPSVVRPERSLFATMPRSAMRTLERFIARPCPTTRSRPRGRRRDRTAGYGRAMPGVLDDQAVAQADDPSGARGDIGLVRDHDHRAAVGVEPFEEIEHLSGRRAVERAGGLVGEDQGGVGRDRTRDRDALLLPTRELVRERFTARRPGRPGGAPPTPGPAARPWAHWRTPSAARRSRTPKSAGSG